MPPARIPSGSKHPRPIDSDSDEDMDDDSSHMVERETTSTSAEIHHPTPKKRVKVSKGTSNGRLLHVAKTRGGAVARGSNTRLEDDSDSELSEFSREAEEQESDGNRANRSSRERFKLEPNGRANNNNDDDGAIVPMMEEIEMETDEEAAIDAGNPRNLIHAPGSIARVKLINFVTYTQVEFFPGPNLNMVIGPNGTGKSTLVCAICLGLGWGPQHLGRAKEIHEFVKHRSQEATIEIELQKRPKEAVNPVIKRIIKKENNATTFYINDRQSTLKAVQKVVHSYSIQIDNLCQFLPQDRVVEFAGLSPIELLRETQRAAAPPKVLEWHENLKEVGRAQKALASEYEADKNTLGGAEQRQAALAPDVERLRDRQKVLREIELYTKAKPFARYRIAREYHKETKAKHRAVEREYKELRAQEGPTLQKEKEKKRYKDHIERAVSEVKRNIEAKEIQLQQCKRKGVDALAEKISDTKAQISAMLKAEKERRNEIARLKQKISRMEATYADKPDDIDLTQFNQAIAEKSRKIRDLTSQAEELGREVHQYIEKAKSGQQDIAASKEELKRLESQDGQRENLLRQISRDSYQAWKFIEANKEKFKKPVYGPPILTCSVKNQRYADQVEHLISNQQLGFTCQTREDYKFLSAALFSGDERRGIRGLGLAEVSLYEYSYSNAPTLDQQKKMVPEDYQGLEFAGSALDFLDGPAPVLNMLCHNNMINITPISLRRFDDKMNTVVENTGINSWVAGDTSYKINRRKEYGNDAKSVQVGTVRKARIFNTQQVDQGTKARIEDQIRNFALEVEGAGEEAKRINEERKRIKAQVQELDREKHALTEDKAIKQKRLREWYSLEAMIEQEKHKLATSENGREDFKKSKEQLERKLTELTIKRSKAALEFATLVTELVNLQNTYLRVQLYELEATSDLSFLISKNQNITRLLKAKETEVQLALQEKDQAHTSAKTCQQECEAIIREVQLTEDEKHFLDNLNERNLSLEALDAEIEATEARLQLLHEGNPNAIRDYERREREIAILKARIDDRQKKLQKMDSASTEVRNKWEPILDAIVAKISRAFSKSFSKIGCAGEVRIHKPPPEEGGFEKWAIEILVKFRDTEALQILTNQRQSGGERAVSTVFYLMALQSLAQAPFRVVDEINQGMDPRNERLVHQRMVMIACRKDTSQYFLVTPKLLPDLGYHPRMRVHVINSGEWVEDGGFRIDVGKCLKRGRELKAMGRVGGGITA